MTNKLLEIFTDATAKVLQVTDVTFIKISSIVQLKSPTLVYLSLLLL
jgi:hypothetical protein